MNIESFRQIKAAYESGKARDASLICKVGFYSNCPVLKLQKATWTNDDMRTVPNQTGIFFSVWIDEKSARLNRANYNIHALKLRQLRGYQLASNQFASDFRKQLQPDERQWPNMSVNYGPLTLMQGWILIEPDSFQADVLRLMKRFGALSTIIDEQLENHRT